jgi:hypothetical protein
MNNPSITRAANDVELKGNCASSRACLITEEGGDLMERAATQWSVMQQTIGSQ